MTGGRRRGGAVSDLLAVVGTFLVLGVLGGVLWWLLVDPAQYTKAAGGATMSELELAKRFGADGWYSVLALVLGFVGGVALTWWRARDPRVTTLLLVPGAALAAAVTAYVGHVLGPADRTAALHSAARGEMFPAELVVTADAAYLLWPIAVLAGALMVLWSSTGPAAASEQRAEVSGAPRSAA